MCRTWDEATKPRNAAYLRCHFWLYLWMESGSSPKIEVLCRLATYFDVTTDYLLGLSEVRKPEVLVLSEKEKILIDAYRTANDMGQLNIIYVCMDEMKKAKGEGVLVG